MNDYEDLIIAVYSGGTELLSEQTRISGSPAVLQRSEYFSKLLHIEKGEEPTKNQLEIYATQREYIVPVMNRGQIITITYANSVTDYSMLGIWLSVTKKGVKLIERKPQQIVFGVQQPRAALMGVIIGLFTLPFLVLNMSNVWIVAFVIYFYGLIAQVPGAYAIKAWRKLKQIISG